MIGNSGITGRTIPIFSSSLILEIKIMNKKNSSLSNLVGFS